jgi:hypothetical protein
MTNNEIHEHDTRQVHNLFPSGKFKKVSVRSILYVCQVIQ